MESSLTGFYDNRSYKGQLKVLGNQKIIFIHLTDMLRQQFIVRYFS